MVLFSADWARLTLVAECFLLYLQVGHSHFLTCLRSFGAANRGSALHSDGERGLWLLYSCMKSECSPSCLPVYSP